MKNSLYATVFIVLMFFSIINAQESKNLPISGKITGYLFDAQTGKPIEYGNIAIFSIKDSSLVTGSISNKSGYFEIDNLKQGKYYCQATFIGYEKNLIENIAITPQKNNVDLGKIMINQKSISIGEVEVKAEKEMYTYNIEKKVVNVDKMLTSIGGSAVDILQNIPSVSVDADGVVSLRGNSNLTVLIDGKPSGMTALSPEDALAQIPASSIESIELVTNPSAKYDPEGTAGIINIILKKNSMRGFNGMASINAGTRDKYNSSLNLNYRFGDFNFYGTMDNRSTWSNNVSSSERFSSSVLEQNQVGTNFRGGGNLNTGIDYFINDFNTLTFEYKLRKFSADNNNDLYSSQISADPLNNYDYLRNSISERNMRSNNYSLLYRKTYDEKYREFTLDFTISENKMENISEIDQIISGGNTKSTKTVSQNTNTKYNLQGNYIHPISKLSKFEIGFASNLDNPIMHFDYYNNTSTGFVEDILKKNYFDYKLQTHAVYATFSDELFGLGFQAGLRAEQAFTDSKSELTGVSYKNDYFSLYPSIHFAYNISEQQDLQFSYSRRVDRPSHRQLNPYVDYTDSLNISYGNPLLKPQYINSYEISYGLYFGPTSFTTSIFGKQTNDVISNISVLGNDGVTRTTYENIAKSISYGMEFIANHPIAKFWKINANFSLYKYEFENDGVNISSYDDFSWTAKINNNFNLFWDLQMQLMFNYSSPSVAVNSGWGGSSLNSQTKLDAIYFADLALKKDFFDGSLSVSLRISDLFNTRGYNSYMTGENFYTESSRTNDSRNIFLGVSYRLNMSKSDEQRRKVVEEDDF